MPKNAAGITLNGRFLGPGAPCFIIAEAGVNHNGSLDTALKMVDLAASAKADAVKFQTFSADRLVIPTAPKAAYQTRNTRTAESQFAMLKKLELSPEMHWRIARHCRERNILFLSTPFDELDADLLDELKVPLFKISSGELTNSPFLSYVASKKKPMIVSTGMATLQEVKVAVAAIRKAGNSQVILLQCVSDYPAQPKDVNLRAMKTMREALGLPVGYSDHTLGLEISWAAAALGACVIEKHFTLDTSSPGPDHKASLSPQELPELVRGIRAIESALGHGRKEPAASEFDAAQMARKSLVAAKALSAGTTLTREMVDRKRPGTGISASKFNSVLGKKLKRALQANDLIQREDIA